MKYPEILIKLWDRKYVRYPIFAFGGIVLLCLLFIASVYTGLWGALPTKKELSEIKYQKASEIYSADSVLLGKYFLYDRLPIELEKIPNHVEHALVAIEDERFYRHSGVDYPSLFRVFFKTILFQDESAGGGSTISQQLIKNRFPRQGNTKVDLVVAKLKEMFSAQRLEELYSKDEILEHYLNTVSFGDNTFGIESASQKFFNKSAQQLSIEEGAVLIGMLKATYGYNPRIFPERSTIRRNLVLTAMVRNDYLEPELLDSLQAIPVVLDYTPYDQNTGLAPYFREEVRKELQKWIKENEDEYPDLNLYTSGLKIYTTLNYKMQQLAEKTTENHLSKLQADFEKIYGKNAPWLKNSNFRNKLIRNSQPYKNLADQGMPEQEILDSLNRKKQMELEDWNGIKEITASTADSLLHYAKFLNTGSMAMNPETGAILTWIGGINHKYFKYDHISQSKRQVGSTFKPFVYTTALERGIEPCTYYSAREVTYQNMEGWTPGNSGDKDEAYLNYSMEEALSNSINTVSVKVLEDAGIANVINQAKKMGISSDLPQLPSLALGTGEIRIPELCEAYASYVNDSRPVKPFSILRVESAKGDTLYEHQPEKKAPQAYSEKTREIMLEMMKSTVNEGTASRIRTVYGLKNDIAGKTGTTQNNKDAWFVALTPALIHISWVGLDHHEIGFPNTTIGQGANAALPLFSNWYKELNKDKAFTSYTRARFTSPSQTVQELLDCKPVKKDGFLKRLFTNPDKAKKRKFRTSD